MKRTSALSAGQMMVLIAKIPFFRKFEHQEREMILNHAYFYIAEKGEFIIKQDSIDTDFYILLKGDADVVLEGNSQVIVKVESGDFFGEMSFALNTARSSNVIATDVCILLQVSRKLLSNLSSEIREKFNDKIIEKMAHHIVEMNMKMAS